MVRVEVREEDVANVEARAVSHHLALGALPAVEQRQDPFALEGDGGEASGDRRGGRGGAEKSDANHGGPKLGNGGKGKGGFKRKAGLRRGQLSGRMTLPSRFTDHPAGSIFSICSR